MTDITRDDLLKRREELQQRLEKIRSDLGRGLQADLAEQAIELENRDTMLEIARITQEELDKVNAQLADLES